MKRLLAAIAFVAIAVWANSAAYASLLTGDTVVINTWWHATGQTEGPFQVTIYDPKSPNTPLVGPFLTFCVETHQYFYDGETFFNIKGDTTSSVPTGRLLTGYAAWVYQKFANLNIPLNASNNYLNSLFGMDAGQALNAYQAAIWSGMITPDPNDKSLTNGYNPNYLGSLTNSEYGGYYSNLNPNYDYLSANSSLLDALGIGYDQFLASNWNNEGPAVAGTPGESAKLADTGGAEVINIDDGNGYGQDQMIIITTTQTGSVPEPASIIVWSLLIGGSWLGMRVWRRRGPVGRQPWSPEARQAIHEIIARSARR